MLKPKRQLLWFLALLACLAVLGIAGAAVAAPAPFAPEDGRETVSLTAGFKSAYVPGELLVKLKPGAGVKDEGALHSRAGAVPVEKNETLGLARVRLTPGTGMDKAMAEYRSSASVEYVQPNYIYHALLVPNDPHYWRQWNMPKIGAEPAWEITCGAAGVVVAVVDTGVDLDHPDLAANLVSGYNFINQGASPQDDNGHGTHVAGIVAAVTNNAVGVAGVAGGSRVMPVKVLSGAGEGTDYGVAQGIQWAADNGARIANLSLGGPDYSQALADAVNYAYGKNMLVVAAAGNEGSNSILYPAALPGVVAVGATDNGDNRAGFSNYGDALDIVAPGVNIFSTFWNDSYVYLSGTSMATPHVSSVAALVLSLHPGYTAGQVESTLKNNAVDLGAPGWDPYYGNGRLDALAALKDGLPDGGGTISGQVYLEGGPNWSGASVSVVGTTYQAITDPGGTFVLVGLPPGSYDLRAGKNGYLYRLYAGVAVQADAETTVPSPLLLLAGDFSPDNMVDIEDLLMIRDSYGAVPGDEYWNTVADVNQDEKIGLVDLVYMARNYAKYGE
jgi:subtilisin family serine protease